MGRDFVQLFQQDCIRIIIIFFNILSFLLWRRKGGDINVKSSDKTKIKLVGQRLSFFPLFFYPWSHNACSKCTDWAYNANIREADLCLIFSINSFNWFAPLGYRTLEVWVQVCLSTSHTVNGSTFKQLYIKCKKDQFSGIFIGIQCNCSKPTKTRDSVTPQSRRIHVQQAESHWFWRLWVSAISTAERGAPGLWSAHLVLEPEEPLECCTLLLRGEKTGSRWTLWCLGGCVRKNGTFSNIP